MSVSRTVLRGVEGASNILLCTPAMQSGTPEACGTLLSADPAPRTVLAITYARSADAWLADYEAHAATRDVELTLITVGDATRSVAADRPVSGATAGLDPTVETVGPTDLTGLGIYLDQYLPADDEARTPAKLCFDSVTALLQYTDLKTAFRFLHMVTRRVARTDTVGHYHVTPEAHDRKTLVTLGNLFDARLTVTDDDVRVTRR